MAEYSCFSMVLCSCYVIIIFFYSSSVHGARQQPKNEIMDMKSLTKVERKLTEYGEGIHLPLKSGNDGNFLVSVGFGTPKRDFTLLFDTGSDKTWIKCQPCNGTGTDCNNQDFFNPSLSSTFSRELNCNTPNCGSSENYNDKSYFTGYFVKDTLTIVSDKIPNFTFSCAEKFVGNFEGASGLLAVGKGGNSLIAQTDKKLLSSFCYCLPASDDSSGYMVFGVQAFETCQPHKEKFIPIEPAPDQSGLTGYYISLTGITIGEKRLEIASYVPSNSSSVQAIIDSGTIISRLPLRLYSALRSVFQEIMSQYPSTSSSEPIFDTCYDLEGDIYGWTPPKIVLHFGSSDAPNDVALHSSAATTTGKSESEVCLAFTGNKDENDLFIIGNRQHRARDLFFDINNNMFYFSSSECLGM